MVDIYNEEEEEFGPQPLLVQPQAIPAAAPIVATPPVSPLQPTVSTTTTRSVTPTREERALRGQLQGAFEQEQEAITGLANVAKAEAQANIAKSEARNLAQQEYQTKYDDVLKTYEAEHEVAQAAFETERQKFQEMDVKDFWEDAGTGTRILAALSMALGAYAQGMGAGPNQAAVVINNAVESQYKLSLARLDKQRQVMQDAGKMTDRLDKQFQMATLQAENKRGAAYGKAATQAESMIAKLGPERVSQEAAVTVAKLKQKQQESELKLEAGLRSITTTSVRKELQKPTVEFDRETYVPGVGTALTKDDAKQLKKAYATKQDLDKKLADLIALRTEFGGEVLNREAVARGKQLSRELLLKYKDLAKLGVLSESDLQIVEAIIPEDPLQFDIIPGQHPTMVKLTKLQEDVNAMFQAEIKARLVPGSEEVGEQATTKPAPHGEVVMQGGKTFKWDGSKYVEVVR